MIRSTRQHSDKLNKILVFGAAIICGIALAAQAEVPAVPAVPNLPPPIPPIPSTMSALTPMAPGMAELPAFQKKEEEKPAEAVVSPFAAPKPGGGDRVVTAPSIPGAATTPPVAPTAESVMAPPAVTTPEVAVTPDMPPPLTLPEVTATVEPLPVPDLTTGGPTDQVTATKPGPPSFTAMLNAAPTGIVFPPDTGKPFPAVHIAKNRQQTWLNELAPTTKPYNIKFNYKRQIMPGTIYAKDYDAENRHLPSAVYREDYDRMFLEAVAANDINGARALLNSGRDVNLMNANGDTALVIAINRNAVDTARLLIMRGANPHLTGPSGRNAYDAAASTGQMWLLPQPMAMR